MVEVTGRKKGGGPRAEVGQRIVASARCHFFTHGFRRFTMDDLAGELGMSKKTLYAWFPTKSALLQAVILDKFRDVEASLAALQAAQLPNFMESLQQMLGRMQQNAEEIRPPFVRDLEREAPEIFQMVEMRRRTLIHKHFKRLFDQGRKTGIIRADMPVGLMIEILLGATEAIANPKKMMELGLVPKTALSAVLKVVLEGVIVRQGKGRE